VPQPEEAMVTITWSHTDTYQHSFPAGLIADAAGLAAEELLADPALLFGVVNPATAELLNTAQSAATRQAAPELEIMDTRTGDQPTLLGLLDRARLAMRDEIAAGSPAGRAFAALIAGLRREGLTD
jgi:hypothetical protein